MANSDLVIGLKTNVARGFGLADMWRDNYNAVAAMLLDAWSHIEDPAVCEEQAWKIVDMTSHYQEINSALIGEFSIIKDMVIPAKTYTNKKGITKTKPEERVPAHYTHKDTYLGRVSSLGDKPIGYSINILITPEHFEFVGPNKTIARCFRLKPSVIRDSLTTKPAPKKKKTT
jgi:hypothetical protein